MWFEKSLGIFIVRPGFGVLILEKQKKTDAIFGFSGPDYPRDTDFHVDSKILPNFERP